MIRFFLPVLFYLVAEVSSAGSLLCDNVTVKKIAYHANNRLMVQFSNMNVPVFFCSPDGQWSVPGTGYTMGPETCKAMFSMFLTAHTTGQVLARVHFDGDDVPEQCDAWPRWSSTLIRYVTF